MKFKNVISVLSIVVFVLMIGFIIGQINNRINDHRFNDNISFIEITVEQGDTLWSIAKDKLPGEDPRKVVWFIQSENEIQQGMIFPGQIIKVPIYQASL